MIAGQHVKARPEVSPQRTLLAKAQAMFYKGLKEMGGDESKVRAILGKLQVAEGELADKCTREGKSHADEGWFIDKHVVSKICTGFNDILL